MAKKKKKKKDKGFDTLHLTIQIEEEEPIPSTVDVFAYHFLKTLSYWFLGFLILIPIGLLL